MSTLNDEVSNQRIDRYHHGDLRRALLEEGARLLEETGEPGFSLRELARRVGVTANAVYRHFANKNALLMGLAAEGFRSFDRAQRTAWQQADGDAGARFLATGVGYVRFARAHPALFRLMFGRFGAERRDDELDDVSQAAFDTLRGGAAAALGLPSDSQAALLAAYNAWALVHGFSHLVLDGQIDGNEQQTESVVVAALQQWLSVRR